MGPRFRYLMCIMDYRKIELLNHLKGQVITLG
jgi:hypothetical protein